MVVCSSRESKPMHPHSRILLYSFLAMSHDTKCSSFLSLSYQSPCEGYYKYNCLIIVTYLRYSQDILYCCKRRGWGQVCIYHWELLVMKRLTITSLGNIPPPTLRTWRHELSPGHAVRPSNMHSGGMQRDVRCWPSPFSASQPWWGAAPTRETERGKTKAYCKVKWGTSSD